MTFCKRFFLCLKHRRPLSCRRFCSFAHLFADSCFVFLFGHSLCVFIHVLVPFLFGCLVLSCHGIVSFHVSVFLIFECRQSIANRIATACRPATHTQSHNVHLAALAGRPLRLSSMYEGATTHGVALCIDSFEFLSSQKSCKLTNPCNSRVVLQSAASRSAALVQTMVER